VIREILKGTRKFVEYIVYTLLVLMTVVICWQVFSRFVLGVTPSWIQELSLLLMVWLGFLGIALGFQDHSHIKITLLENRMPLKMKRVVQLFHRLLAMLFGLFMVMEGTKFANSMSTSYIPGLKIPSAVLYFAVPISGILIVIYIIAEILGMWRPVVNEGEEAD
jgi:TRAP-type C4-dicarboxylate transport system permease small subunit